MRAYPITLLLGVLAVTPLRAWKTKVLLGGQLPLNRSVHELQTRRALELLQAASPENAPEWQTFQTELLDGSGTLQSDANAHGNLIFQDERIDPATGELFPEPVTALDYNSGPFYRYWIRALEANGQANADVPIPRETQRKRYLSTTYRYFGYMAHLVEDQCVPAHAANVRHGPWDGVEWWHWKDLKNGGQGVDEPLPVSSLLPQMEGIGWDRHPDFANFWGGDYQHAEEFNPGSEPSEPGAPCRSVNNFLVKVIQNTRDRWMPGLAQQLEANRYFAKYSLGGRVLENTVLTNIWWQEDARNFAGYSAENGPWQGFSLPLAKIPVAQDLYQQRPQWRLEGAATGTILLDPNRTTPSLGQSWDANGTWGELNRGCTPWLPYPKYTGEAFDGRWGSYGGAWGFPGRVAVDGPYSKANLVADALVADAGRITPGDIYMVHTGQPYAPELQQTNQDLERTWEGFNDERTLAPTGALVHQGGLEQVGLEQVNKSAMWAAVLMENLSRALPPRIVHAELSSRQASSSLRIPNYLDPSSLEAGLPGWLGKAGAWIDLKLSFNRRDEHAVEFYLVPQSWFQRKAKEGGDELWKRKITWGKTLWNTDLDVNDSDGNVDPQGSGPGLNPNPNAAVRDYDFAYDQMPVIPLKVVKGKYEAVGAAAAPDPSSLSVLIPPSELTRGDAARQEAPWYAQSTYTWTGEVDLPKGLFSEDLPEEAGKASDYIVDPKARKLALKQGNYFLLVVAYRKYWRNAFARNQFKSLSGSKALLEMGPWWSSAWNKAFFDNCRSNQGKGASPETMIPDELIPFRYDPQSPKIWAK